MVRNKNISLKSAWRTVRMSSQENFQGSQTTKVYLAEQTKTHAPWHVQSAAADGLGLRRALTDIPVIPDGCWTTNEETEV